VSTHDTARQRVAAVAARDVGGIAGTLAPDVRFRYLIPPGAGEVVGADNAAAKYFAWFGGAAALEVLDVLVKRVSDRTSATYRFLVHGVGGWEVIEQQTFLDVDTEGQITSIDLLCSGFRPAEGPKGVSSLETHEFDAGTMGCTDGLAPEFRRRIGAIPMGDVLVVTARDPAAKEDLPPLARMMGHTIHSIEAPGDGRLIISVERGR
jgi:TusA-related sulfurtransferase